jgi:hypothetical protein
MKKYQPYIKETFLLFISLILLSVPQGFGQADLSVENKSASALLTPETPRLSEDIKLYPVPVKSELTLENISSVTLVEVFDVTGKKHISESCSMQEQLKLTVSQLPRGVYFIRFVTPKGAVMKRFIKE